MLHFTFGRNSVRPSLLPSGQTTPGSPPAGFWPEPSDRVSRHNGLGPPDLPGIRNHFVENQQVRRASIPGLHPRNGPRMGTAPQWPPVGSRMTANARILVDVRSTSSMSSGDHYGLGRDFGGHAGQLRVKPSAPGIHRASRTAGNLSTRGLPVYMRAAAAPSASPVPLK